MIAAACLLLLAPCQDLEDLATRLRGAVDKSTYDGNRAYTAAKELVELRSADAMKLRLELYDARWSTYRGVYLRDWFYSGMQRAASPAETALLAAAAADSKRSDALRTLCLQALASCSGPVPAEDLLDRRFLKAEPMLRRAWQQSLGKLVADGRLDLSEVRGKDPIEEVWKLLEKAEPQVGYALAGGPGCPALLRKTAASAKDPADRALALRALAVADAETFARVGEAAFRDRWPGPRCAYLEAAVEARAVAAVPGLVRSLRLAEDEELARWRADCGAALRALTGLGLGDRAELWERWWADRGPDWLEAARAGDAAAPAAGVQEPGDTVARFFGLAVDSANLVVLVDGSGSMSTNMLGELDCARAAAAEARRFLGALDSRARFDVGVVEVEPKMAFGKLTKPSRKAIDDAAGFLEKREYKSRSALVEALEAAIADPMVDTVVLISDGGSSDGLHRYPKHMLEAAKRLHAEHGLRVHTILVTDSDTHERFMRELAETTGGRAVRAEV